MLSPVVENHGVSCRISGCESLFPMLSQWLWIIGYHTEALVLKHGDLCSASELFCDMLSQWLWIMVCYSGPVVANHGVLCWASGCES
jgi:hypothetical protein